MPTKAQKRFNKSLIREVERLQRSKGITEEVFTESYNDMLLFFCGNLVNSTGLNETAIRGVNKDGDALIVTITKKRLNLNK